MKCFTFHTVVFCLYYNMQLLPSSIKEVMLTKNIPAACPGETLIYTCISEGILQRWRLHPSADRSSTLAETSFRSGVDQAGQTKILMGRFNVTLISANLNNFTSVLKFIASQLHQSIAIECSSLQSSSTESVGIVDIPIPPHNFEIIHKEFHENFSSVTLVWSPPSLNQSQYIIDHYQIMVETEGLNNTMSFIYWINSTETMITVSTLPYSSNVTLSLFAHNCIGESQALTIRYRTMKCDDITSSFLIINGSFSQIPGSRVELFCVYDPLFSVVIECQDDGSWQPNPANMICDYDPLFVPTYAYTHGYSDLHMPTSQTTDVLPKYMQAYTHTNNIIMPSSVPIAYVISVVVATGVALLLLVTGVVAISCCVVKRVYTYRRTLLTTATAPTASPDNQNDVLYEEISPNYETPNTTVIFRDFETRLTLDNHDLFTHRDTKFTHSSSDCITRGIQLVDNEAYNHGTSLLIITKATVTDDSSSTAEHDYDACTSNNQVEGLSEPLYDDTVI